MYRPSPNFPRKLIARPETINVLLLASCFFPLWDRICIICLHLWGLQLCVVHYPGALLSITSPSPTMAITMYTVWHFCIVIECYWWHITLGLVRLGDDVFWLVDGMMMPTPHTRWFWLLCAFYSLASLERIIFLLGFEDPDEYLLFWHCLPLFIIYYLPTFCTLSP